LIKKLLDLYANLTGTDWIFFNKFSSCKTDVQICTVIATPCDLTHSLEEFGKSVIE